MRKAFPFIVWLPRLHRFASFENYRTNDGFDPDFLAFIKQLRGINTWSREIVDIFKKHCPIYFTRIGIDEKLSTSAESKRNNRKFTIGWVGNIKRNTGDIQKDTILCAKP